MDTARFTLDIQQRRTKSVTHTLKPRLRARKRDTAGISAVPPYHPDYDEPAQLEYGGGEVVYDDDDGELFAEYEKVRQRMPFVRRGSSGHAVRPIDREQLLAEYIAGRAQEDGYYCRYVPATKRL